MSPRPRLAARRKALGHSQETLARVLDVRPQSVARWEQGMSTPLARYRRPLAEVLELTLAQLEDLIDGAGQVSAFRGHAVPSWLDHYASLEQAASRLQTFEPISVPGLLQTSDYATAVMRSGHVPISEEVVRERVDARLARQAVLERDEKPLELVCVIDESVLHRVTGGSEVMAAQLQHLLIMGQKPTVQIHIVPASSGALHSAAFGSFRLFTSEGAAMPFMTCTEDLTGFNYLDRREAISAHTELFSHLTNVALPRSESAVLIEKVMERYNTNG
ncbi:MAG: helix-turn-helix domain-containing protein [Acidimicrobiales bacterium]